MKIFEPNQINKFTLKNRIIMPPMCMYMAQDGFVSDFHIHHYATRAMGGVAMIIVEASGVMENGRISDRCLGLWKDEQIEGMKKLVDAIHSYGSLAMIQLNHAGRKSTVKNIDHIAPSAVAFSNDYDTPKEMDENDIASIRKAFVDASERAMKAGFDGIEIHGAHGYLLDQFLSPLSNFRKDVYGQNKNLLMQQVIEDVREAIGEEKMLFLRVSAEEYEENGIHPKDIVTLLKDHQKYLDALHVSSGGNTPKAPDNIYPGYQVPFAFEIKKALDIPVVAVGILEDWRVAESVLQMGQADYIALGRGLLFDPYWVLHTMYETHSHESYPESYIRGFVHHSYK